MTVLLKWMQQDPVDTWEMGRNDAVESISGNRNVFIDHPEFANMCFDTTYEGLGALKDLSNIYDEVSLNYIGINKKNVTLAIDNTFEIETKCFPTLNHNLINHLYLSKHNLDDHLI